MSDNGEYLPPHNDEAELGLLSAATQLPVEVFGAVTNEHLFYDLRHRALWCVLRDMWADKLPINDPIVVRRWVNKRNLMPSIGSETTAERIGQGEALINEVLLSNNAPPQNWPEYLHFVTEDFNARRGITAAIEFQAAIESGGDQRKAVAQAFKVFGELESTAANGDCSITIRTPDEILAMELPDRRLLADGVLEEGQPMAIVGAGGTGKTRMMLQLAAATITSRQFAGLETRGDHLRWLFLQCENSNKRLQDDFSALRTWTGSQWQKVNAQLRVHTLEDEFDGVLSLASSDNVRRIEAAIRRHTPDIVVYDSLYNYAVGDLNKDEDMRQTLFAASRVARKGNPMRTIVVLHHSLTGKAGAAKATGFDRGSFGRNSKVLHSWARGQINVAPGTEDGATLVLACGKCSNGREFPPFAVRLNPDTMIYEPDPHFNLAAWQSEMSGKTTKQDKVTPQLVRDLCPGKSKPKLVKAIMEETGCGKSAAYDGIDRAEAQRLIAYSKALGHYAAR